MAIVNTISLYAVLKPKLNDVFKEDKRKKSSLTNRLRSHRLRETAIRRGNS